MSGTNFPIYVEYDSGAYVKDFHEIIKTPSDIPSGRSFCVRVTTNVETDDSNLAQFISHIQEALDGNVVISIDHSQHVNGLTFIDVYHYIKGSAISVGEDIFGYNPDIGFCFYDSAVGFGDKPTETVATVEEAIAGFDKRML